MNLNINSYTKMAASLAFAFVVGLYLSTIAFPQAGATNSINPPEFPSCEAYIGQQGDWTTAESGDHHIPGQEETISGSDDIFQLENGNFLQCLCPPDGNGYQTNWWQVADRLSQEEVEHFIGKGWFFENGSEWNLFHTQYLAKNTRYNCAEPTPTPTPEVTTTPTPTTTPKLTPTPTVAPTPTPKVEVDEPRCVGLSASPSEGTAPLTVVFTGSGFDKNGPILEYEFDYGDASGGQPQVWRQEGSQASHRYEHPGKYIASLKVKDQGGTWRDGNDDCRVEINVRSQPQILAAAASTELPKTGTSALVGGGLLALTSAGAFLYRRFRLV